MVSVVTKDDARSYSMSCHGIPGNSVLIHAQERDIEAVFFSHLPLLTCGIVVCKMSYRGLRSKQHTCAFMFSVLCICFNAFVTITECAYTGFKAKSSVKGCVPNLSW